MKLHLPDRSFAGYIFDCDGTIADTMPLHYRAWTKAMEKFGGQFPEDLFYAWGGTPTITIVKMLNEKFGLSMDPEATVAFKEDCYLKMLPEVQPIAAVVELVKQYHGKAPMAVASGGNRQLVLGSLGALGLVGYFDAIICAEDYEHGKPSPDPFLVAAKAIGVPPQDCLVFEDSPIGVKAAEAAGMEWVLVPSPATAAATGI